MIILLRLEKMNEVYVGSTICNVNLHSASFNSLSCEASYSTSYDTLTLRINDLLFNRIDEAPKFNISILSYPINSNIS